MSKTQIEHDLERLFAAPLDVPPPTRPFDDLWRRAVRRRRIRSVASSAAVAALTTVAAVAVSIARSPARVTPAEPPSPAVTGVHKGATAATGDLPSSVVVDSARRRVYVASEPSGGIIVHDASTLARVGAIVVGGVHGSPRRLAYHPRSERIFAVGGTQTMWVVNVALQRVVSEVSLPSKAHAVVADRDSDRVVVPTESGVLVYDATSLERLATVSDAPYVEAVAAAVGRIFVSSPADGPRRRILVYGNDLSKPRELVLADPSSGGSLQATSDVLYVAFRGYRISDGALVFPGSVDPVPAASALDARRGVLWTGRDLRGPGDLRPAVAAFDVSRRTLIADFAIGDPAPGVSWTLWQRGAGISDMTVDPVTGRAYVLLPAGDVIAALDPELNGPTPTASPTIHYVQ